MPKGQVKSGKKEMVSKTQVKQMVKSMLREVQELKLFVTQTSGVTVDYAGNIVDVSPISQGDSDITRDGDRVQLVEWAFQAAIYPGDSTNLFRIILFQYTPDSALGTPLVSYVLQTTSSVNAPITYRSIDFVKSVKILHDRTYSCDTYHPVVLTNPITIKKFFDRQMQFTGATTRTNGLFLLFISDSSASSHPTIQYYSTIRFTDS
jgi:hypothetical protein